MTKSKSKSKILLKEKVVEILSVIVVIILTVVVGFFIYNYFTKPNNFKVENKYYGFQLQTPRSWIALENTKYSEDRTAQSIEKCKKEKTTEILGKFRFESFKYTEDIENLTGAMLEIIVNCVSGDAELQYIKNKNIYISPKDKSKEMKLNQKYEKILNEIISSIIFINDRD